MRYRTVITDRNHLDQIHPAAVRLVVFGNYESWSRYLILDRAKVCAAVREERRLRPWNNPAVSAWPCGWYDRSGGPGQSFSGAPVRYRRNGRGQPLGKRFIVIHQMGGLDV